MLLGFAVDYKKIIPNAKHELILTRGRSDDTVVFTDAAADRYQFSIKKVAWTVPHITLSDSEQLKLY